MYILVILFHLILRLDQLWFKMLMNTYSLCSKLFSCYLIIKILLHITKPLVCSFRLQFKSYCLIINPDGSKHLGLREHSVVSKIIKIFKMQKIISGQKIDTIVRHLLLFVGQVS
jgi:hypothetical protein